MVVFVGLLLICLYSLIIPCSSDTVDKWITIASDYSGENLVAADSQGRLFSSTNYGGNWSYHYQVDRSYTTAQLESSSSGEFVVYMSGSNGGIYYSNNYGVNWTMSHNSNLTYYLYLAMNANGSRIYLLDYDNLTVSTDYAQSFTAISALPDTGVSSFASNAEGNFIAICFSSNYALYTSSDYGVTWQLTSKLVYLYFDTLKMSGSGQYLIGANQYTYVSSNYGRNWTLVEGIQFVLGGTQVGISYEGDLMSIAIDGGYVYLSKSYGQDYSFQQIPNSAGKYSCMANDYSGYRIALGQNPGALVVLDEIPTPTSMPSSQPSCSHGEGSTDNAGGCEPCPPGTYVTALGGVCANCPKGYYTSDYEESECNKCVYPSTSVFTGSDSCEGFSLAASVKKTVVVMCILAFVVLVCICASIKRLAFLVHMIFPTLDLFSDIAYLMTNDFYVPVLFYLGVVFVVAPIPFFLLLLRQNNALVPHFACNVKYMWWLSANRTDDGVWYPVFPRFVNSVDGRLPCISPESHHSGGAVCMEGAVWFIAIVAQLLTLILFPLAVVLNVVFLVFWLFFGFFIHMSKTISVGNVWNLWFTVWTGSTALNTDIDIDTEQLNGSLQHEFYFETLPQFVLQLSNNVLLKSFTPVAIFSLSQSLFMAINGMWRFFYYRFIVKKPLTLKEIPIDLTVRLTIQELNVDWLLLDGKIEPKSKRTPDTPMRPSGMTIEDPLLEDTSFHDERSSGKL